MFELGNSKYHSLSYRLMCVLKGCFIWVFLLLFSRNGVSFIRSQVRICFSSQNKVFYGDRVFSLLRINAQRARGKSLGDPALAGIRLNKCLSLSRRAADAVIEEGRVTVNGAIASPGTKVSQGDKIRLVSSFLSLSFTKLLF